MEMERAEHTWRQAWYWPEVQVHLGAWIHPTPSQFHGMSCQKPPAAGRLGATPLFSISRVQPAPPDADHQALSWQRVLTPCLCPRPPELPGVPRLPQSSLSSPLPRRGPGETGRKLPK